MSARPSWPRRSPARRVRTWSGCSATRASTRHGRCTSGTTRSSSCASRPRATRTWDKTHDDIFTDEFLLTRPLLTAIRREEPTVLLIDEVDKTDVEVEGLLLEILSDFQVTIPEMGTIAAVRRPLVVLTSNATRELSEAIKRRCLFLHIDYPDAEREREIVVSQVPEVEEQLAGQIVEVVAKLRGLELRKAPSIAETIDWARTLVALGTGTLDSAAIDRTLGVVLKHSSDHERAVRELRLRAT